MFGCKDAPAIVVSHGEKSTLAEIAHQLGRKALAEIAVAAKPDTILGWFRKLVVRKFDVCLVIIPSAFEINKIKI